MSHKYLLPSVKSKSQLTYIHCSLRHTYSLTSAFFLEMEDSSKFLGFEANRYIIKADVERCELNGV